MKSEVLVKEYLETIPEIVNLTKGQIYTMFAPSNTSGVTDAFIVVNRAETVPIDRSLADEVNWLRVKVDVDIYGKAYDKVSSLSERVRKTMELKWEGSSDGEIGLDSVELSTTVWKPFRLSYQIFERIREEE